MADKRKSLIYSYNNVAEEYAARYFKELESKPFDRDLLKRFADMVIEGGLVCDLGCGPGQITGFMHSLGLSVTGIDISLGMVDKAKNLNDQIDFRQGDMLALKYKDCSIAGLTAFYSIIHTPLESMPELFREFLRVLKPGGILLFSFHAGDDMMLIEELWGEKVSMDFYFFPVEKIEGIVKKAGFRLVETLERPPYKDVEYESNRAYVLAEKP